MPRQQDFRLYRQSVSSGRAGMEAPLGTRDGRFTHIVEPIVGLSSRPAARTRDRFPTKTASVSNSTTPTCSRKTGSAELTALRAAHALPTAEQRHIRPRIAASAPSSSGRAYRFSKDNDFGADTGLDDHFSDIVGRVESLSTRYRQCALPFPPRQRRLSPRGVTKWKPPSACRNSGSM